MKLLCKLGLHRWYLTGSITDISYYRADAYRCKNCPMAKIKENSK